MKPQEIKINDVPMDNRPSFEKVLPNIIEKAKLYDELKAKIEALQKYDIEYGDMVEDNDGMWIGVEEVLNLFK